MDVDTVEPGVNFVRAIEKAVGECDVLVALIGKRWLGGEPGGTSRLDNPRDYVRLEVSTALAREIRVIPVLVDGMTMPNENSLPSPVQSITERNAIEISNTRFNYDVDQLINAVRNILDSTEAKRKADEEAERNRSEQEAERRRLEAEAQRKTQEERLREQERQRSEEEAKRKAEEENRRRIEEEENRAQRAAEQRRLEAEAQRTAKEDRIREQERQRSEKEAREKPRRPAEESIVVGDDEGQARSPSILGPRSAAVALLSLLTIGAIAYFVVGPPFHADKKAPIPLPNQVQQERGPDEANPKGSWLIVAGSFGRANRPEADKQRIALTGAGFDAAMIDSNAYPLLTPNLWVVGIGPFETRETANAVLTRVNAVVPSAYVKKAR